MLYQLSYAHHLEHGKIHNSAKARNMPGALALACMDFFTYLAGLGSSAMTSKQKHIPIRLTGLSDGVHELRFDVAPADIELPAEFGPRVDVRVDIDKSHHQVAVHAFVRTSAVYPCDRCLEAVSINVETEFRIVFVHDNSADGMEDDRDIRAIDPSEPVTDLADDVREAALLCIPMRRVCGENEEGEPLCAKAIPVERDADATPREDMRWDTLKSLKFDQ